MKRQSLVAREYKVMLRSNRFRGNAQKAATSASAMFADFARSADRVALGTEGELKGDNRQRVITFWDTKQHHLNGAAYIFRQRDNLPTGEREVTLKFRHRDRNVAQDRDMNATDGDRAKTKFEEDIKKPFVSLYSFSTTLEIEQGRTFRRLRDIERVFPGIRERIRQLDPDEEVVTVNDFAARELVLKGASVKLGRTPEVRAECALILWYRNDRDPEQPVAVEFSYRYGDKDENYGGTMAGRAFDVFKVAQHELRDWIEPSDLTKTALVYGKQSED